jgi:hypothetical protein
MRFSLVCLLLFPALASPQTPITVTAKGVGPVPGAVVCRNMARVSEIVDLYAESMEERMQAAFTGGASSSVNGSPLKVPDLQRYGCALAKPGTMMTLESEGVAPVVRFKTEKGRVFRGVTQSNMYSAPSR